MLLISFEASALDKAYRFKWSNTTVTVPLSSDLDDYKYVPTAKLYIDNKLAEDAVITIDPNGDWLYLLEDVDVNEVGEYKVWYKAYETKYKPGTCTDYKTLVTFKVVDTISPVITQLSDRIVFNVNEEISLDKYFKFSDNYSSDIKVNYYYTIDNSKSGIYDAKVVAIDSNNNSSELNFTIEIIDPNYPTITFTGVNNKLTIELNEEVDIKSYFTAVDREDGDLIDKLEFNKIDSTKLQTFDYTVKVSDSSGNETTYTIEVEIVDEIVPEMTLTSSSIVLDINDVDDFNALSYVSSLIDNNKIVDINEDNILVSSTLAKYVGEYYITYTYIDEGGNKVVKRLDIVVTSKSSPVIKLLSSPVTTEGNPIDLSTYLSVVDSTDENVSDTLIITGDIDYETAGKYTVEAYAINSSGVSSTLTFTVKVEEDNFILRIFKSDNWVYLVLAIIVIGFCLYTLHKVKEVKKLQE